jgi:hypothetical protein
MTFLLGALPNSGTLQDKFVPVKSIAFTSGGSDLDLTNPAGFNGYALELYCTSTGNIIACLAGDVNAAGTPTNPQTYPVVSGQVLQGAFVLIKSTSTANCIARQ